MGFGSVLTIIHSIHCSLALLIWQWLQLLLATAWLCLFLHFAFSVSLNFPWTSNATELTPLLHKPDPEICETFTFSCLSSRKTLSISIDFISFRLIVHFDYSRGSNKGLCEDLSSMSVNCFEKRGTKWSVALWSCRLCSLIISFLLRIKAAQPSVWVTIDF